jgi:hypothetical protein
LWKNHPLNDEFLVLLGPIISRLFTWSNGEKNKQKQQRVLALSLWAWVRKEKSYIRSALTKRRKKKQQNDDDDDSKVLKELKWRAALGCFDRKVQKKKFKMSPFQLDKSLQS